MQFLKQEIDGLILIQPYVIADDRGSFSRIFCLKEFASFGFKKNFVQSNVSYNLREGTFRGLHFQKKASAECKLVNCIMGAILDIVVDVRPESKTFLKVFQIELSEKKPGMLFIPEGCAHGFLTLQDNCTVLYHHTAYYDPQAESGLRYDDPALNLKLPLPIATISPRDQNHPLIAKDFKGYL
jgi:dTDP-4-dehydrorhamnose 3,5-epimerase